MSQVDPLPRPSRAAPEAATNEPARNKNDEVLRRAVAKIVAIGERVGVSSEEMISLLQSGLTVRDLLDYLAARERYIV